MYFRIKRKFILLTIVCIILGLSMVGAKLNVIETMTVMLQKEELLEIEDITTYRVDVNFDPVEKILTAKEKITYKNKRDTAFNALYFHLYPNAFKTEETVPFEKREMELAYPKGFEPGYIQIDNVKNNEENLNYVTMGVGESILKVNLNKPLEIGEKITLEINFTVKIPPSTGRFGYGTNTINIANWYPILSVFDGEKWNLEPYYAIGDPFYSDMGDYRVVLAMPKEYVLASTGKLIKKESIDGKVYWTLEADAVRDFAMIVSDQFKVLEDEINDIKINCYYFEDPLADLALQTAKDSIQIFSEIFGKYPYPQFSVAASDFFIGGMEYPNLVFIDTSLYKEEHKEILEYIIAHETAHQWWYGIVGNDEIREPWLDEALTEYSTLLYYEKKYGEEKRRQVFKEMIVRYYEAYRAMQDNENEVIYRSIKEFKDAQEYQALVYHKGAMFIDDLRKQLGDELFFQTMKVYFDKYKYKNANTEDFIKVCEQVSNKSLRGNFRKWLKYEKE
ncbi:M1 family metallopeptidase [Clostridiaceae bacterium 35-E11]